MSSSPKLIDVIHKDNPVVHDDAHKHDDADKRHDRERRTRYKQGPSHTDDGKWDREQNDEGIDERFKLRGHDHISQDHGDEKSNPQIHEGFHHILGCASDLDAKIVGNVYILQNPPNIVRRGSQIPSGHVNCDAHFAFLIFAENFHRCLSPLDARNGAKRYLLTHRRHDQDVFEVRCVFSGILPQLNADIVLIAAFPVPRHDGAQYTRAHDLPDLGSGKT